MISATRLVYAMASAVVLLVGWWAALTQTAVMRNRESLHALEMRITALEHEVQHLKEMK